MADESVNLAGKVAIVTGAGAGIGRAIALALAQVGAAVCVSDVNPDRAETVVEAIQADGGQAIAYVGDVAKRFTVSAMIEDVRDAFGGLHIVVNAMLIDRRAAFLDLDEYDWRRVLDMNLGGAFNCTQLAARVMVAEGGGVVVNVLSEAARQPHADGAAHAASQAGLVGLTQAAARSLETQNVRVNAVVAGTDALDDAAQMVLFLCSDVAASVAGQIMLTGSTASSE